MVGGVFVFLCVELQLYIFIFFYLIWFVFKPV
jgi:hypothetical protein